MFERISNGWNLALESWHVLRQDKQLLVFPLFSGIACLLVLASFAAPLMLTGYGQVLAEDPDGMQNPVAWLLLFAYYCVNYFVIVFFNSALVACAAIRLRGGDPTIGSGFRAAMNRLPQIAGWAVASATVGVILKAIESRSEKVGAIVAALLGAAWTIGTFFVVPVLVIERLGPIDATKRSLAIIRDTWGESLVANMGIGLLVTLAALPLVALLMGGIYLLQAGPPAVGGTLIALAILGMILLSLISSALDAIVLTALYLYAADDTPPGAFDGRLLRQAFASK
ncbi:MAG: hypothetical protein KDA75_00880 [Planctomycetaceae bacterium]|nr:hypothetical protein [Planctomycetaceae bacterium]